MRLNTQVATVDYQGDKVMVTDHNGKHYTADKVIVSVPLKILQDGDISFTPALPADKTKAINNAVVWGGIKVFLEFSEQFYPTLLETPDSATISRTLSQSVGGKLFFAGDAYTQEDDWGAVHNATQSARDVVQEIIG